MSPFDAVAGGSTPDSANEGRAKWNAMASELDSRMATLEGAAAPGIAELQTDATSNTTAFMDSGLGFDVEAGVLYQFHAFVIWSPQTLTWIPFNPTPSAGSTQGATFSMNGPGSTPSPVTWLHYLAIFPGSTQGAAPNVRAYSQYDQGVASSGATTGDNSSTGDRICLINGFIQPPSDGTLMVRFKSQLAQANGIVVRAGSTIEWW